jgi:tetratricopeptide (TPR) repeat protein
LLSNHLTHLDAPSLFSAAMLIVSCQFNPSRRTRARSAFDLRLRLCTFSLGLFALLSNPAQALMIGAPQTRAELGRTLQMDIPVRLDGQESLPLSCVQAQAQAGEFGGNVGALAISSKPTSGGVTLALRSQQPLREPILIVRLHLACQFQRTQVYTLLVDPPAPELPMTAGSAAVLATPSAGAERPSRSLPPAAQGGASTTSLQSAPAPALRKPPRESKPLEEREAEKNSARRAALRPIEHHLRAPAVPQVAIKPPAQSRLEMDDLSAVDLMASPELRLATALPTTLPKLSPEQRAQLGQLRQLVMDATAAPGDAQTLQQINALQARANVLQRQFEQASQQLQRSQSDLARVRAQSYSASVVYALIAALMALGALSFWLWRRGADPGLHDSPFVPASVARPSVSPRPEVPLAAVPTVAATSMSVQASTIQPPVMPFGLPPSVDGRPLQPEIDAPYLDGPAPSTWGHSGFDWDSRFLQPMSQDKQVHVDELMDAGHLAEYFIDMGDESRAMDLLEKSLDDSASGSFALPYLLLFDLYRKHGRKQEFESLYTRFERRFNVAVPAWDASADAQGSNRDLMDYDRAMKLITMAWGEPQIVSVLEHMLMDDPQQHRMGFDLAAYRDLLMLYTVARDLFPDAIPTSTPIEHIELTTRLEPVESAGLDLDFELPLDIPSAPEAPGPAASAEFKLLPRTDDAPKNS